MNEVNKANLSEQTKLRLSEIIKKLIKRNDAVKKLSKYVTAFDCIDNTLIVLNATSSGVCIILSAIVVGAPVGITSLIFTLNFSLTARTIKKLLSITRNKKKEHDKILMLPKSKLDSIETLVSQVLTDIEISPEEFNEIIREKQKFERRKKI